MPRRKQKETPAPVGRWGARDAGILHVATELYAARGYENVTMADVARAAGLSEGTLYNYFRDKQHLVLSVCLAWVERTVEDAERIAVSAAGPREGLKDLITHQLRNMLAEREIYRIWLREVRASPIYEQSEATDLLRRFSNQFARFLGRWGARPAAGSALTAALMRDMLYGGLEQIGRTVVMHGDARFDVERTAAALADAYLAAFGLEDAPARRKSPAKSGTRRNHATA
jgi:TetR/AcrR family transcriptional regulator, fatty acid metabolism regulator protein